MGHLMHIHILIMYTRSCNQRSIIKPIGNTSFTSVTRNKIELKFVSSERSKLFFENDGKFMHSLESYFPYEREFAVGIKVDA